ncbi:uncharacterized protein EI90DRAFT_3078486 [Cantharellus anzutake]|uniref:uncharacterized protein n=1 Tax=Cantharellus anzutake TaxID=1750568 RepID=UPI001908F177|nr:uncharacterized protein EI90DRAFT_3078486 [Cantharellus anzutake]KAF8321920.1 hypothetical protein EI90DRAFT_3078486 [Cantharellus anzutake]
MLSFTSAHLSLLFYFPSTIFRSHSATAEAYQALDPFLKNNRGPPKLRRLNTSGEGKVNLLGSKSINSVLNLHPGLQDNADPVL